MDDVESGEGSKKVEFNPPPPDVSTPESRKTWLETYVLGHDKSHERNELGGEEKTPEEMRALTHDQMEMMADFMQQTGRSPEEIQKMMVDSAKSLYDSAHPEAEDREK